MKLFVGLGNPGPAYSLTRHNIGFLVIDSLLKHHNARNITKKSFDGELWRDGNIFFLKPMTYMNLSGRSVATVINFFKIPIEDVIVIHDDIDLSFGALRIKKGGGNGGHNGLKSIDSAIGKDYLRIRMGVGKPVYKSQVVDYVLQPFTSDEQKLLPLFVEYGAKTAEALLKLPLNEVKSKFSQKNDSYLKDI